MRDRGRGLRTRVERSRDAPVAVTGLADTVFLFGAGVNLSAKCWADLTLPLSRDFFKHALRHPRLGASYMQDRLAPFFAFTQRFWRMGRAELLESDLDLEECFTAVELQRREAEARGEERRLEAATVVQSLLGELLVEYLGDLDDFGLDPTPLRALGEHIYRTQSVVLR